MAVGRTLLLKLRYRPQPRSSSDISSLDTLPTLDKTVSGSTMTSEVTSPPNMQLGMQPDPLMSSYDHDSVTALSLSIPPPPPMVPLTTSAILSQRRRRKSSTSLKRSASTPNVRGHPSSDAGMTLAEKRRNKLGYHRISIACGHCRRRKIRCLAAPDDHQGRCANCIRLKKECTFLPVDQQPTMERRPRAGSRVDGRGSTSSGSSPPVNGAHSFGQMEPFGSYGQLPLSSTQDYVPSSTAMHTGLAISPLTRGELPADPSGPHPDLADWIQVPENLRSWEFPQHPQRTSWGSPFGDPAPISAGYSSPGEQAHSLWGRHSDSPGTPGFSPHMAGPTSSMQSFSDSRGSLTSFAESRSSLTSFAPSRTDSAQWSVPPSRSMSYGLLEGLPMNTYDGRHYYPQAIPKDVRRRASEMHPPSLLNSANSSTTSISEGHPGPISAPIPTDPAGQNWSSLPQSYNAFPGHPIAKSYDHGWYPDSAPLAKVQEEEMSPHFGSGPEPAILYAGGEHHQ